MTKYVDGCKKDVRRKQFSTYELSEKTYDIYSNSDVTFYQDWYENYYYGWHYESNITFLGSLENVEEYLLTISED